MPLFHGCLVVSHERVLILHNLANKRQSNKPNWQNRLILADSLNMTWQRKIFYLNLFDFGDCRSFFFWLPIYYGTTTIPEYLDFTKGPSPISISSIGNSDIWGYSKCDIFSSMSSRMLLQWNHGWKTLTKHRIHSRHLSLLLSGRKDGPKSGDLGHQDCGYVPKLSTLKSTDFLEKRTVWENSETQWDTLIYRYVHDMHVTSNMWFL